MNSRSQGPDGGVTASRYCYIGGFDGTSNALAGMMFGMKVGGTHAHSFVQSFSGLSELDTRLITLPGGSGQVDFVEIVLRIRSDLNWEHTNKGELAAFICYCQAFPDAFLALVDTYDTLVSGIPNFLMCAVAMFQIGYQPLGIR
jgi:nicotinate phosphoribosyltransferase